MIRVGDVYKSVHWYPRGRVYTCIGVKTDIFTGRPEGIFRLNATGTYHPDTVYLSERELSDYFKVKKLAEPFIPEGGDWE